MTKTILALAIMGILAIGIGTMQQSEAATPSDIEKTVKTSEIKKAMKIKDSMADKKDNSRTGLFETLRVPFDTTFVSTTEKYKGLLFVSISGNGESIATNQNDAFYIFENAQGNQITPYNHQRFYQLSVGTDSLVNWNPLLTKPNTAIKDFIVFDVDASEIVQGPYVPEYQEDHEYNFVIDLNNEEPEFLSFGVSDGWFADNSGNYKIAIIQLPIRN